MCALALATPARAQQCGAEVSQCRTCHEAHGARPVAAGPLPWHIDHGFADFCARCHGGDARATDAAVAHVGVSSPLLDVSARCGPCHGADTPRLARGYLAYTRPAAPPVRVTAPIAPPRRAVDWPDTVLAMLVLLATLGAIAYVARNERRLRARPERVVDAPAWWRPYAAGALLGATTAVSMALFGHRMSGSGAYVSLSGYVGRALAPRSVYWQHVVPTGVTWEVYLALGMFVGSLASAVASKQFALRVMPDTQWTDVFGRSVWTRWLLVFVGTAALEVAAGLAGGCTAGLAVSGGAVFAPGAFVFMAAMFASGIPVARWLYRRHGAGA